MKPGRDLDALIAEKVLQWKVDRVEPTWYVHAIDQRGEDEIYWNRPLGPGAGWACWSPSTSLEDCWPLRSILNEHWGPHWMILRDTEDCCFIYKDSHSLEQLNPDATAQTLPLVLCLAVLVACKIKVPV